MEEILTLLKDKYNLKKENDNLIYGIINDYQVVISFNSNNIEDCYVRIFSNFRPNKTTFEKYLVYRKNKFKLSSCFCTFNHLTFHLISMDHRNWMEKAEVAILGLTDELKEKGFKDASYCIKCGKKMINPTDLVIKKTPVTVCEKCSRFLYSSIKNKKRAPKKRVGGSFECTLASLGGGLLGGLIWFLACFFIIAVFYKKIWISIVASIFLSFIISFLASLGYDKRNGEKSKKKIIINIIVSYISILVAINSFYFVIVYEAIRDEITNFDLIYFINLMFRFSPLIWLDAFMGMLFGSISILPYNLIYLRKSM